MVIDEHRVEVTPIICIDTRGGAHTWVDMSMSRRISSHAFARPQTHYLDLIQLRRNICIKKQGKRLVEWDRLQNFM